MSQVEPEPGAKPVKPIRLVSPKLPTAPARLRPRAKPDPRTKEVEAAARDWIEAKRKLDTMKRFEGQLKHAASALKEWFRETGYASIDVTSGTIGYSLSSSTVLDLDAVRAHLGKRVPEFEKSQPRETLSLLGERKV